MAVTDTIIDIIRSWYNGTTSIKVDGSGATQPVSGSVSVSNFPATQPVSGTVTANAGTNLNTSLLATASAQTTGNASLSSIDTKLTSPLTVTGSTTTTRSALSPSSPTSGSVGTSSAQVLAANSNRKGLILINTSTNNMSFGLGTTALLNSGITLTANGTWVMDEYTFYTGAINAIASSSSSNLSIQELA